MLNDLLAEIVDCAEGIKTKAEKIDETEERDRQDFETDLRQQIEAKERHWETRFELLVEKIDDFERGLITLGELKEAAR